MQKGRSNLVPQLCRHGRKKVSRAALVVDACCQFDDCLGQTMLLQCLFDELASRQNANSLERRSLDLQTTAPFRLRAATRYIF